MYSLNLPNFDRFEDDSVWRCDNVRPPLMGKDLNRFIIAIEQLDSEVYWLKGRLDTLEENHYDHVNRLDH